MGSSVSGVRVVLLPCLQKEEEQVKKLDLAIKELQELESWAYLDYSVTEEQHKKIADALQFAEEAKEEAQAALDALVRRYKEEE